MAKQKVHCRSSISKNLGISIDIIETHRNSIGISCQIPGLWRPPLSPGQQLRRHPGDRGQYRGGWRDGRGQGHPKSTVDADAACGISIGFLLVFLSDQISMEFLWNSCGISAKFLRNFCGISDGNSLDFYGLSSCQWPCQDPSMEVR